MLLLTLSALAQSPLPMSSWDYPGVLDADGEGYVTMELVKNTMNKNIRFAGKDLAWGAPIPVEARMAVDLRDAAASGDKRYVWVAADKNGVLLQLDAAGKELGRKTFAMPNHRLNDATLYSTGDGGVVVVMQNKVKKIGKVVDVTRLDAKLQPVWSQQLQVEKKGLKLVDSAQAGDVVVILAQGMKKAQEVVAIGLDGTQRYRMTLNGGDRALDATAIGVAPDGTAGVFGDWTFTGAVHETDKPGQHFFAVVDPSGEASVKTETWDPATLRVTRTGAQNREAKLHVHDVVATDGGFRLIGETFTWTGDTIQLMGEGASNQTQETPFDVWDVALIDFGRDGSVLQARRLHEPTKRTVIRAFGSGMDQTLEPYGRLGLRFVDGDQLVLSHDDHNVVTVSCVAQDADHVPLDARQWLGLHTVGDKAQSARWAATYSISGTDNENGNTTLKAIDILPAAGNGFVVAHLANGELTLERRACEDARDDGLLQGLDRLDGHVGRLPGGGAFALYAREAAEDGEERYQVVVDDGQKVHRAELDLPSTRVTRTHNDRSLLQVNRDGSVHHLARVDRTGHTKEATLDLSGDGVTGAVYAGAGDTFVVATTFRNDDTSSYVVNWLDGELAFTASSPEVAQAGSLSLRALDSTASFVAFQETWRSPDRTSTTRKLRVFDRTGKPVREIGSRRGEASRSSLLSGAGLLASRWSDGLHTVDALDAARGSLTLDGGALESALQLPGLATALSDDALRVRLLDLVDVQGRPFVVAELLKGAGDSDDQVGWGTDFVVLELSGSGALKVTDGTLVSVTPAASRDRYLGLVPNGDDVELVFLDLQQNQWVASAALLSAPERRRFAPTALPPLVETEAPSGPTLAFVEKLDRMGQKYEQGVKRLEAMLGSKAPPAPPKIDPATRVIPMGNGMVRVVHHRPDWRIAQWEMLRLQ